MPAAKEGQKLCMVCGQDVSGKPRVKDAQGRYVCAGECQQKLAAKAAARPAPAVKAPPAPAEDDVMGRLINASPMMNAHNCGECGAPMVAGSVVCVRCGHNTQTGKSLKTAVVKEKEAKVKAPPVQGSRYASADPGNWGPSLGVWFAGAFVVYAGSQLLTLASPLLGLVVGLPLAIVGLVALIYSIVVAFQSDQKVWGLVGIITLIPLINLITIIPYLIYLLFLSPSRVVRGFHCGSFLGTIVGIILVYSIGGPEALGFGLPQ